MATKTLIYKYPKLKALFETQCMWRPITFNMYGMFKYSVMAHFLNPHAKKYYSQYPYSNESNYLYYVSMDPSNKVVGLLMKNLDKINLDGLVQNTNPKIGPLLEHSLDKFDYFHRMWMCRYSSNPTVMAFLEKHPDKIIWSDLSENTCDDAIKILEKNQDKIDLFELSGNSSAMDLIKKNLDKVNFGKLCTNTNPEAILILEQNLDKIDEFDWYYRLLSNPSAIHIIEQNLDKIVNLPSFYFLSKNSNAMDLLMKHPELIHNRCIFANPNALSYLESLDRNNIKKRLDYMAGNNPNAFQFIEKMLNQGIISNNDIYNIHSHLIANDSFESLFDLDYQAMSKTRTKLLQDELMAKAFHPSRVAKWLDYHCENGGDVADFEM
jgi:hypothetical protein